MRTHRVQNTILIDTKTAGSSSKVDNNKKITLPYFPSKPQMIIPIIKRRKNNGINDSAPSSFLALLTINLAIIRLIVFAFRVSLFISSSFFGLASGVYIYINLSRENFGIWKTKYLILRQNF